MSTLLLISFLSMLSFAANAEEYFEEVDSGIALKYSEFKAHSSIAVEDIDVNSDGKLDLVFHFWSGLSGLSSELLDSPPPDFLKIYVQSETGGFEDKTQEILGEIKPSLRGASRHVVKGDFNNDGKEDLAYAINYEDARLVDDPADLSAQLAALISTASGYEIRFFGTPSWYHSLGVGADEEGRSFVTGNGFSGNFQAELWRFDESNNALAVNADGLEVPPNAFEFLTQSTEVGTDLLLRNANYPDMFGIYAYQRVAESWTLVDQINNPYEELGSVSILGWNATGYGDASVVDINGYASLEGGGSSYAESCSIRLRPDDKPVALFKVSSAYVPTFGEVDSITSEDTVIFNSLVGFGFENNKITKNILRIEDEDPFINANFFDCADVDGDGYDDIAMYPYGQNPLVYINDQKGKFYKLDAARIPSVKDPTNWYYGEYGALSSLLRDLTGDGIPDLLFWPASGIPDNNFGNEFGEYLDIKMFKGINRLTKNSVDSDGDSISDENEARLGLDPLSVDSDEDGTSDPLDAFPLDSSETSDADNDTIGDNADAFPLNASESVDTDADGIGNNTDTDDDGDQVSDDEDAFPLDATEYMDTDLDGTGNNTDADDDGDGIADESDSYPLISLGSLTDTDGDGRPNECDSDCQVLGMTADSDDDGDSYSDAFENAEGTNASDLGEFPGSRGYINVTSWIVSGDLATGIARVRVSRLFSSDGRATVAYRTVDGAAGTADVSYTGGVGLLEWEDGESGDKTIEIKLLAEVDTPRRDFFVELFDPSIGTEILGWRTQVYYDGFFQNKQLDGFSGLINIDPDQTFAEGSEATVWVKRLGGFSGEVKVEYEVSGCGSSLNEASSDPREGVIVWLDGDNAEKPIRLRFEENDETINRRLDCNGYIYLRNLEPASAAMVSPLVDGVGRGYLVYNNDFTKGVVHAAQPVTGTSEGLASVEVKLVRRGPPSQDTEVIVEDTRVETGYSGYYLFGQNGVQFDLRKAKETLSWAVGEAPEKSIFVDIKNNTHIERDSLIKLQTSGADFDRYKHLFVYAIDDEPIFSETDTDGDGLLDRVDPDMDGDGVYDWWDTDADGDGFENSVDSHYWDASQWVDIDYDGVGDDKDWKASDPTEQFDTDNDGVGNNADTDDDGDGVLDTADAFPLDPTESLDTDADGTGDNVDAFPSDAEESIDTDGDQVGDNADNCPDRSNADQLDTDGDTEGDGCDLDDDNDGFSDEEELAAGTDPLGESSCPGCFNWDIDDDGEAAALTDGLLMMRHMFGFGDDSLTSGAIGAGAGRATPGAISSHLTGASAELDVDGDGESKPLTDGLLLIRYLYGFSGESLIKGAVGAGAERDTAEEVEAYIKERVPTD